VEVRLKVAWSVRGADPGWWTAVLLRPGPPGWQPRVFWRWWPLRDLRYRGRPGGLHHGEGSGGLGPIALPTPNLEREPGAVGQQSDV